MSGAVDISPSGARGGSDRAGALLVWGGLLALVLLAGVSLVVGAGQLGLRGLLADPDTAGLLLTSRLPRTAALILAGMSSAITGLIIQRLVQNRFVDPTTMGTVDSAALGLLLAVIFLPAASPMTRMGIAALFAWGGTGLFLLLLRAVPRRSPLMPPLLGISYGAVIGAAASFIAWQMDLMQSLGAWMSADFSIVLSGRYEMLYLAAGFTALAWVFADRFTLAGLGDSMAKTLGLNPGQVLALGITIVAAVAGCIVVTVGFIPFLGLIVPNLVSRRVGDNLRRALPAVALLGAVMTLACDIAGRLIFHPYELPIGVTMGVLGAVVFLVLLLRSQRA
ncbi:ABC transporter permease [Maritimibacter alkaliphilus]|uniref:ABC transporter permease n=1 Tax=Maritimibacter alkaliphilus TaxID=404236 RepID=UPI0028F737D6|nr:iron chelate uptake ABC transporter family permease subunit [Maritimibacter alkaliphilus]